MIDNPGAAYLQERQRRDEWERNSHLGAIRAAQARKAAKRTARRQAAGMLARAGAFPTRRWAIGEAADPALAAFVGARFPVPAFRAADPGAWLASQLHKSGVYRALLRCVLQGMSAFDSLRLWSQEDGDAPTVRELEVMAQDFRASQSI